jgi:hypothetical protein
VIRAIKWNARRHVFEVFEEVSQDACRRLRRVLDYRNEDGTALPIIADRAIQILQQADIRLWPLEDRMKLFDREDRDEEESRMRGLRDHVRSVITDDYTRIAGIPTFFFGANMPVGRAGYRPGQAEILKKQGLI